jgi:hypothetical protein
MEAAQICAPSVGHFGQVAGGQLGASWWPIGGQVVADRWPVGGQLAAGQWPVSGLDVALAILGCHVFGRAAEFRCKSV